MDWNLRRHEQRQIFSSVTLFTSGFLSHWQKLKMLHPMALISAVPTGLFLSFISFPPDLSLRSTGNIWLGARPCGWQCVKALARAALFPNLLSDVYSSSRWILCREGLALFKPGVCYLNTWLVVPSVVFGVFFRLSLELSLVHPKLPFYPPLPALSLFPSFLLSPVQYTHVCKLI